MAMASDVQVADSPPVDSSEVNVDAVVAPSPSQVVHVVESSSSASSSGTSSSSSSSSDHEGESSGAALLRELRRRVAVRQKAKNVTDDVFQTSDKAIDLSPAHLLHPEIATSIEGGTLSVNTTQVPLQAAMTRFAGSDMDLTVDFSDTIIASMPHRRVVERVHGLNDNMTESIAQRIIRLRRDIPQTVDTILSMRGVVVAAENSMCDDPVLERKESALLDNTNPFAQMHQQLESSLDDTGSTIQRYMLNNEDMQHQYFGPSDAQVALCDPFRSAEYIPFQALKYQMDQASKLNSAGNSEPILTVQDMNALHALSWDACNAKYGEVYTRLEDLERQVGVADSEPSEACRAEVDLLAQVKDLEDRLQLATSDRRMTSLERRMAVLTTEIDVLVGRGTPKEDVNDTPSETNFSELYALTEECGAYFEEFENLLPAVMQVEDTFRDTVALLKRLQATEDKQLRIKALTQDATTIIDNVKKNHTDVQNMRTGKQSSDAATSSVTDTSVTKTTAVDGAARTADAAAAAPTAEGSSAAVKRGSSSSAVDSKTHDTSGSGGTTDRSPDYTPQLRAGGGTPATPRSGASTPEGSKSSSKVNSGNTSPGKEVKRSGSQRTKKSAKQKPPADDDNAQPQQ